MIRQFRSLILIIILSLFPYQQVWACGKTVHLNNYAQSGEDVTEVLQFLVNRFHTIVIDEGEWLISGEIQLRSNVTIKGVDAKKSVLKRSDNIPLKGGMLFYTEKANPDSYVKQDPSDEFNPDRVKCKNISFEDLTIDFNRSPLRYSQQVLRGYNLYGIAMIRTKNSKVKNCRFVDQMTPECNNGYPAIVIYQSDEITIEGNVSERVTLLQATYSRDVTAKGNDCMSSVGTALEFIAGTNHSCIDNRVENVWWPVSCIGVNSLNCVVKGNVVNASASNISCLTLGHETVISQADNALVERNIFHSAGCRSVIIQNGRDILIRKNICSCVINKDSPDMTSGCIVASGNAEGIYDIKIEGNTLSATGNGSYGCITYRGRGLLHVRDNSITANRGISVISTENCIVEITGNSINSRDYSILSSAPILKVWKNSLKDGIIANAIDVEITDNVIEHSTHYSFLGDRWDKVIIEGNNLSNTTNSALQYVFLLDGSKKTADCNVDRIKIRGNDVMEGDVKEVIAVSGAKLAPQLRRIRNIKK